MRVEVFVPWGAGNCPGLTGTVRCGAPWGPGDRISVVLAPSTPQEAGHEDNERVGLRRYFVCAACGDRVVAALQREAKLPEPERSLLAIRARNAAAAVRPSAQPHYATSRARAAAWLAVLESA